MSRGLVQSCWYQARWYATKLSFRKQPKKLQIGKNARASIQPGQPARTRFAPSPTGYLHLGSLRTALYNHLLARSTNGQFLLRLEDTDRNRLVDDAEQNIYDTLSWCGLKIDEGPQEGGPYGPYRQSERTEIYKKYAAILVKSGFAYYCRCSKERLNNLRETATKLKPPTTVTYDRKCLHAPLNGMEGSGEIVLRFKSPEVYDTFHDLMHGELNLQPQYNQSDRRYDDFVIMKSDGLPTYHFANVVDDHLMKITHVIRGEEWLPSTPKHIALYNAFGWEPPRFVHIPLLTSTEDKKLSKRSGDIGILSMRDKGLLPEAVVNFCALFGWSPPRDTPGVSASEVMDLEELSQKFSLDNLTKGNAKINDSKLYFFNKNHVSKQIKHPEKLQCLIDQVHRILDTAGFKYKDREFIEKVLLLVGPSLESLNDLQTKFFYLFNNIDHSAFDVSKLPPTSKEILNVILELSPGKLEAGDLSNFFETHPNYKKKEVYQTLRFALSGGEAGITIPILLQTLGESRARECITDALKFL